LTFAAPVRAPRVLRLVKPDFVTSDGPMSWMS